MMRELAHDDGTVTNIDEVARQLAFDVRVALEQYPALKESGPKEIRDLAERVERWIRGELDSVLFRRNMRAGRDAGP